MRFLCLSGICLLIISISGCYEKQVGLDVYPENKSFNVYRLKEKATAIVREGLADQSGLTRSHAIEVVSETGEKELMPMVKKLLKDDSVAVRFAAALAIGDTKYFAGQSVLERLQNDNNENVRIGAAYALTKLGKNNLSNIIRKAIESKDQTVRANAVMLLGKLGNKKDLRLLYRILRDPESNHRVRIQAIEAIAMFGDEGAYRRLWALLISKYADDRVMGIHAMGALKTVDAKNAIIRMLDDDIVEVQLSAAEQLGILGDKTGQTEVLNYLMQTSRGLDAVSANRANVLAAMAIGRIGSDSLSKFLPKFMNSKSKEVQLSAAQSVLLLTY